MEAGRNRLTKYGIAGLAGIALLGWIREPERHFDTAGAAAGRATFQFQPASEAPVGEFSGHAVPGNATRPTVQLRGEEEEPAAVPAEPTTRRRAAEPVRRESKERQPDDRVNTRSSATPIPAPRASVTHDRAAAESAIPSTSSASNSRHDFPRARAEQQPEQQTERRRDAETDRVARVHRTEDIDYSTPRSTQPTLRTRQERSTRQSAMIIAGATAAGAAIGGMSGGGKGAAIGAITAGAGGYVYDRMTRNRGGSANSSASTRGRDRDRDSDLDDDQQQQSRFSSRFSTPGFAR